MIISGFIYFLVLHSDAWFPQKLAGFFILLPFLVAHFYRTKFKGVFDPKLYLMAVISLIAFVVTTPYVLGDFKDVGWGFCV